MNQKRNPFVIIVAILVLAGSVLAGSTPVDWRYSKPIQINGANKYKAVWLDTEVYRYTAADLSDLRVLDVQGQVVPYFIQSGYESKADKVELLESTRIGRFQKKARTYYDFRLNIPSPRTDPRVNRLRLDLPDHQFYQEITVQGSHDGRHWTDLGLHPIYRVKEWHQNEIDLFTTVKLPYYRLGVLNALDVSGLTAVLSEEIVDWREFRKRIELPITVTQSKDKTTVQIRNDNRLKIASIDLDIEGDNFQRRVALETASEAPVHLEREEIFRLRFETLNVARTDIALTQTTHHSVLNLFIFNGDDRPLEIKAVHAAYYVDKLIFDANGKGPFRLVFGHPKATRPQFDIEQYRNHIESGPIDIATLGRLEQLSQPLPEPKTKDYTLILNGLILLVALLMIFIIIKQLKKVS